MQIFNKVISFLTERHNHQKKIILKMFIADSNTLPSRTDVLLGISVVMGKRVIFNQRGA